MIGKLVFLLAAFLFGMYVGIFVIGDGIIINKGVTERTVTGQAVGEIDNEIISTSGNYTWTKAICNDNECIDVLIHCSDGKVESIEPASKLVENYGVNKTSNQELCE